MAVADLAEYVLLPFEIDPVVNGRYVAELSISAKADEQDKEAKKKELSQRVAAQYLIFQKADQKAGLK